MNIDNLPRELRYYLLQSCSWMNNEMRQLLHPHGITPKQFNILQILEERKPESLSIQEIREQLADKMSDASRLVDRLDKKGLIDKFPSDFDRRSNRARITDRGSALLSSVHQDPHAIRQIIGNRMSDEEVQTLIALLQRLS